MYLTHLYSYGRDSDNNYFYTLIKYCEIFHVIQVYECTTTAFELLRKHVKLSFHVTIPSFHIATQKIECYYNYITKFLLVNVKSRESAFDNFLFVIGGYAVCNQTFTARVNTKKWIMITKHVCLSVVIIGLSLPI